MKILITGARGFIGRVIVNKLLKSSNHNILILIKKKINLKNKNVTIIKSDIDMNERKFEKIKNFQPKIVIHLAWEGIPNYSEKMSNINFIKQKNFFEKLFKINSIKKIISTGSCSEIKNKFFLTSRYFVNSKKKIKNLLSKNCKLNNLSFVWFRLFYVYGKGQRKNGLIPFIINKIKKKEKIKLKKPNAKTDFINVEDVVNAINKKINFKKEFGVYELGNGFCIKNSDIVNYLKKINKKNYFKYKTFFNKYKNNSFYAKLNYHSKWQPKISLEKGLLEMKYGK